MRTAMQSDDRILGQLAQPAFSSKWRAGPAERFEPVTDAPECCCSRSIALCTRHGGELGSATPPHGGPWVMPGRATDELFTLLRPVLPVFDALSRSSTDLLYLRGTIMRLELAPASTNNLERTR